jgi:hypothetical protein
VVMGWVDPFSCFKAIDVKWIIANIPSHRHESTEI